MGAALEGRPPCRLSRLRAAGGFCYAKAARFARGLNWLYCVTFLAKSGHILGPFWGHFGAILGSFWPLLGHFLGQNWVQFYGPQSPPPFLGLWGSFEAKNGGGDWGGPILGLFGGATPVSTPIFGDPRVGVYFLGVFEAWPTSDPF